MNALTKLGGLVSLACLSCGALQATQYLVTIQAENGQYLCANNGGGSTLIANRDYVGSWETFEIDDSLGGYGGGGGYGISIKSTVNPKFLCWDNQYFEAYGVVNGPVYWIYLYNPSLVINRDYVGSWETFALVDPWSAGSPTPLSSGWINTKIRTSATAHNNGSWLPGFPGSYVRAANGGGGSVDGFGGDYNSTYFVGLSGWTGTRFQITVLAVL